MHAYPNPATCVLPCLPPVQDTRVLQRHREHLLQELQRSHERELELAQQLGVARAEAGQLSVLLQQAQVHVAGCVCSRGIGAMDPSP